MAITPRQRSHLRSLGHHLEPIVTVGKEGVTEGVVQALERALLDHELVKVRVGKNTLEDRRAVADALARDAQAECAQILGNTLLLYRAHPDDPTIVLPR